MLIRSVFQVVSMIKSSSWLHEMLKYAFVNSFLAQRTICCNIKRRGRIKEPVSGEQHVIESSDFLLPLIKKSLCVKGRIEQCRI